MAGNYPDVPSHRMPYDTDGTVVVWITPAGVITQLSAGDLAEMNDEDSTGVVVSTSATGTTRHALLFPEPRDILGYWSYVRADPSTSFTPTVLATSTDTTNGLDGTWTTVQNPWVNNSGTPDPEVNSRTDIQSISTNGIMALRFTHTNNGFTNKIRALHLYGVYDTGAAPDRLEIWNAAGSARLGAAGFDWGNVPRGTSDDVVFTVMNLSSTLTANDITVALQAATDTTPTVVGQHTLSSDGSTFTATLDIGDLAPGAVSGPLTLRRITPSNATLSAWVARLTATPVSMT